MQRRPVRRREPVAEIFPRSAEGGDLHVLGEGIVDLPVARANLTLDALDREEVVARQCQALLRTFAYPLHKRGDDTRPGAPGDVKARYGIPVSDRFAAAALRPPDDGKELHAALAQRKGPSSFRPV